MKVEKIKKDMTPSFKPTINPRTDEILKQKVELEDYKKTETVIPNNAVAGFWK